MSSFFVLKLGKYLGEYHFRQPCFLWNASNGHGGYQNISDEVFLHFFGCIATQRKVRNFFKQMNCLKYK